MIYGRLSMVHSRGKEMFKHFGSRTQKRTLQIHNIGSSDGILGVLESMGFVKV
jgi:hypothetical protein